MAKSVIMGFPLIDRAAMERAFEGNIRNTASYSHKFSRHSFR
jgi:hypothetical protein